MVCDDKTCETADCIFVEWAGDEPMLEAKASSLMAVQSSVLMNVLITGQANIVDVSKGGTALFSQVALVNVHISTASIVGTFTDSESIARNCLYENLENGEDNGTPSDVYISPVDERDRSMFGEEFMIEDAAVSDCAHVPLQQSQATVVLPGCAEAPISSLRRPAGQACIDTSAMPAQTVRDQGSSEAGPPPEHSAPSSASLASPVAARTVQMCVPRSKGGPVVTPTELQADDTGVDTTIQFETSAAFACPGMSTAQETLPMCKSALQCIRSSRCFFVICGTIVSLNPFCSLKLIQAPPL